MSSYMDKLYETDEQRQTRLFGGAKSKKAKPKKAAPKKAAPLMKPTSPGLGNTINAIKRRNKYLRDL